MSKAIKAGLGYVIGNYMLKGLSFLTIPIFTHLLTPSDYGTFNTFTASESICMVLLGLAIHSSYKNAKYKYGDMDGKNLFDNYVSTTMLLLYFMVAIFIAIFLLFSGVFENILGLERRCIYLLVPCCFGYAVICCFNAYVGLQYKFQKYLLVAATNAVSSIALSIILIKTFFASSAYMGRILGATLPVFLIGLVISIGFIKKARPCNYRSFLNWGIRYSLPIVPHGLSQTILSQFDRVMIYRMIGTAQAGIYSFSYTIYTIYHVTLQSLDNAWGPWFYEKRHSDDLESIKKTSTIYISLMALFNAVLILISPEIVRLLAPSSYHDAVYSVMPVVGAGFFVFLYNIPASVEYYYEKTKFIALGTVSAAILNIVLNFIFITKYGYIAAAYTTLVTYVLYFTFHYILAYRIEGKSLFDTKKILLISLLVFFVIFAGRLFIDALLVRWAIAATLCFLLLFFEERSFGFIKKKLRKLQVCKRN